MDISVPEITIINALQTHLRQRKDMFLLKNLVSSQNSQFFELLSLNEGGEISLLLIKVTIIRYKKPDIKSSYLLVPKTTLLY